MMRMGTFLNKIHAKRHAHLIEVIMIGKTQHTHTQIRTNDLFSEIDLKLDDDSEITVSIEPRDLYETSRGIFGFMKWIRKGEKNHYILIVNENGEPISESTPDISGKVLRVARDWKGLGKAISDSFGGRLQLPRMTLVIGVGIGVLIIIIGVWRGWIPTPTSWGIGS